MSASAEPDWPGEVPSEWQSVPLQRLCSIVGGGTPTNDPENWEGEVPFVTPPDLRPVNGTMVLKTDRTLTPAGAAQGSRVAPAGSVILSVRAPIGYVARAGANTAFNQGCKALVSRGAIDSRFLVYLLVSGGDKLASLGRGTTFMEVSAMELGDLVVPLPEVATQVRIVNFLDRETARIDTLIEKQEKLIETLRERWAATIVDGVTGGTASLQPKTGNAPVVLTTNVPDGWNLDRLKHSISSIRAGAWGNEPNGSDEVFVVRVADFDRPRLRVIAGFETIRSIQSSDVRKRELREGDLLLEKSGGGEKSPVGFTVMYLGTREKAVVPSNFVSRIRVRPGLWPRYWLYLHQALYVGRVTARSVLQTTGIQNLDQRSYLNEVVPYPPLKDQREIAMRLDEECRQIDTLIAKAERFIELAKERRSALITAAVTGKIEVGEMAVA